MRRPLMQPYILDPDGKPIPYIGLGVPPTTHWSTAEDHVDGVRVSTVFLGRDHDFTGLGKPILWETMIFGGEWDGYQERYTSQEAAIEGHARVVASLVAYHTPYPSDPSVN